jgi:hypothetical protein
MHARSLHARRSRQPPCACHGMQPACARTDRGSPRGSLHVRQGAACMRMHQSRLPAARRACMRAYICSVHARRGLPSQPTPVLPAPLTVAACAPRLEAETACIHACRSGQPAASMRVLWHAACMRIHRGSPGGSLHAQPACAACMRMHQLRLPAACMRAYIYAACMRAKVQPACAYSH